MAVNNLIDKKALSVHLNGLSCPIGDITWNPPPGERDTARLLLNFLKERSVLTYSHTPVPGKDFYVFQSILRIRKHLALDFGYVKISSVLGESITGMRIACRKFVNELKEAQGDSIDLTPCFLFLAGELRAFFGIHVARIACAYNLELDDRFNAILPMDLIKK